MIAPLFSGKGFLKSMKYLVTGGAGFIGTHLCRALLKAGHQVICLDNFQTGSRSNLTDMLEHPGFSVVQHDVCEPFDAQVDGIFHLACPASPVQYQANPIHTLQTSFLGTYNMLVLAERLKVKLLFTSTSEVYGDPLVHPQPEHYWGHVNTMGPRACYDEGKRAAETLCREFYHSRGVQVRIARIFNTYGPGMSIEDGRVVSNFIVQALRGQALTLYGDGKQTRSLCYIQDTLSGLLTLMDSALTTPVNIGSETENTIIEITQTLEAVMGVSLKLKFLPLPTDDPKQRKADITKARAELGWAPKVPLQQGLLSTIEYFKNAIAEPAHS